jgi:hypothetical protein
MRAIGMIVLSLALASCGKAKGDSPQVEPPEDVLPPAPEPPAGPAVTDQQKEHMVEHFIQVAVLRDAVIAGDLEATRAPATWLAEHGAPDNIPDAWIRHVTDLKVIAGEARDADDLETAAAAVGALGRTCGNCHQSLAAELRYELPPEPPALGPAADHMRRHQWGAERMWDGLFIPSDDAWKLGATAFFESPLHPDGAGADDPRRKMAKRVHLLGSSAAGLEDPIARGTLYGDLLATCAGCHQATDELDR